MAEKPTFGNGLSLKSLNSLDEYILFTMDEPWQLLKSKIEKIPQVIQFNFDMNYNHLLNLADQLSASINDSYTIVGLGGGTSCDTAKFLVYWLKENKNLDLDLILIPSIISVDAFLCSSIAVRIDNKVKYIGQSKPNKILIDYDLIRKAPSFLNRAGVSDTISIASALGDWLIAKEEIDEKFSQKVFNNAKKIVIELMEARKEIRDVSEKGIKALVNGFSQEVVLCEEWGNARPEEGSEHFLAYCLEALTHKHYIHGNLIGMNILISLFLQEDYAQISLEDLKQFFYNIMLRYSPKSQIISDDEIRTALRQIKKFVIEEKLFYSIYNSSKLNLNSEKIESIINFLKSL
jgi:glycerol-1-phosphate dehydrogenase [NAD(P)+]